METHILSFGDTQENNMMVLKITALYVPLSISLYKKADIRMLKIHNLKKCSNYYILFKNICMHIYVFVYTFPHYSKFHLRILPLFLHPPLWLKHSTYSKYIRM